MVKVNYLDVWFDYTVRCGICFISASKNKLYLNFTLLQT